MMAPVELRESIRAVLAEIDAVKPKPRKVTGWAVVCKSGKLWMIDDTEESAIQHRDALNAADHSRDRQPYAAVYVTGTEGIGPE